MQQLKLCINSLNEFVKQCSNLFVDVESTQRGIVNKIKQLNLRLTTLVTRTRSNQTRNNIQVQNK